MSFTTNGWKPCAPAPVATAARHSANTAAIAPVRSISAGEQAIQVVVESKCHHYEKQRQANALPELHRALGNGPAFHNLDRIIQQVSAIEQRDGQQVEHAEADADEREEREVRDPSELRRLPGEVGDRDRS